MRPREVKSLVQSHTANKWENRVQSQAVLSQGLFFKPLLLQLTTPALLLPETLLPQWPPGFFLFTFKTWLSWALHRDLHSLPWEGTSPYPQHFVCTD